jgi:hypothetical protein
MNSDANYERPVILSWDVGMIHLSYCLLTQKPLPNSPTQLNWHIIDWNNIDLTNRNEQKCQCGAKASLTNIVDGQPKYHCKTHGKKVDTDTKTFEECFEKICTSSICTYKSKIKTCTKAAKLSKIGTQNELYCSTHAKQLYKADIKTSQLKDFKIKSSTTMDFADVKYKLIMELESKPALLKANYVVIENQPSFKNPRMKSIATTLYDYYLIRGIIDKTVTKSNISQVHFMSPSNKLKLADHGDTKQLIKAKKTDDTKAYKLTKSLGIKYCLDLTTHLENWQKHFNSHKKKDDLADSFLQGAYFYSTLKPLKPLKPVEIDV